MSLASSFLGTQCTMCFELKLNVNTNVYKECTFRLQQISRWLRGPAVEHWSLADVLSLSCARLVADG